MAEKRIAKKKPLLATLVTGERAPCAFCQEKVDDELNYGKFYAIGNIQCHYYCVLLSCCLIMKGKDEDEGLLGFLYEDIKAEVERSKKHRCSYCGKAGASLGCSVAQCKKQFHLPCGRKHKIVSLFYRDFRSFCVEHAPKQKIPDHIMGPANLRKKQARVLALTKLNNRKKKGHVHETVPEEPESSEPCVCVICYEDVEGFPTVDTFWPPCCARDAWFHRQCLQRMALSAGMHYLKCPLCNDKEQFYDAVIKQGYHVPDRDAAWELEQNAFAEIYERPLACSAEACLCPNGRNHDADNGPWDIKLCILCGTLAVHTFCLKNDIQGCFVCDTCKPHTPEDIDNLIRTIEAEMITESSGSSAAGLRLAPRRRRLISSSDESETTGDPQVELYDYLDLTRIEPKKDHSNSDGIVGTGNSKMGVGHKKRPRRSSNSNRNAAQNSHMKSHKMVNASTSDEPAKDASTNGGLVEAENGVRPKKHPRRSSNADRNAAQNSRMESSKTHQMVNASTSDEPAKDASTNSGLVESENGMRPKNHTRRSSNADRNAAQNSRMESSKTHQMVNASTNVEPAKDVSTNGGFDEAENGLRPKKHPRRSSNADRYAAQNSRMESSKTHQMVNASTHDEPAKDASTNGGLAEAENGMRPKKHPRLSSNADRNAAQNSHMNSHKMVNASTNYGPAKDASTNGGLDDAENGERPKKHPRRSSNADRNAAQNSRMESSKTHQMGNASTHDEPAKDAPTNGGLVEAENGVRPKKHPRRSSNADRNAAQNSHMNSHKMVNASTNYGPAKDASTNGGLDEAENGERPKKHPTRSSNADRNAAQNSRMESSKTHQMGNASTHDEPAKDAPTNGGLVEAENGVRPKKHPRRSSNADRNAAQNSHMNSHKMVNASTNYGPAKDASTNGGLDEAENGERPKKHPHRSSNADRNAAQNSRMESSKTHPMGNASTHDEPAKDASTNGGLVEAENGVRPKKHPRRSSNADRNAAQNSRMESSKTHPMGNASTNYETAKDASTNGGLDEAENGERPKKHPRRSSNADRNAAQNSHMESSKTHPMGNASTNYETAKDASTNGGLDEAENGERPKKHPRRSSNADRNAAQNSRMESSKTHPMGNASTHDEPAKDASTNGGLVEAENGVRPKKHPRRSSNADRNAAENSRMESSKTHQMVNASTHDEPAKDASTNGGLVEAENGLRPKKRQRRLSNADRNTAQNSLMKSSEKLHPMLNVLNNVLAEEDSKTVSQLNLLSNEESVNDGHITTVKGFLNEIAILKTSYESAFHSIKIFNNNLDSFRNKIILQILNENDTGSRDDNATNSTQSSQNRNPMKLKLEPPEIADRLFETMMGRAIP